MRARRSVVDNTWAFYWVMAGIAAIGLLRIAATYRVFNQTFDEPYHIVRGMIWLTGGTYRYVEHPPLAEACFAIAPYLDGVGLNDTGNKLRDGNQILYGGRDYFRTLSFARGGNLIFFLWSIAIVWHWTNRDYGPREALLAVLLFTNLPPVLGHAGLATTDMAITATVPTFVYVLVRWRERRSCSWAVLLGLATGAALLSKFSAILFLPAAGFAVWLAIDCCGKLAGISHPQREATGSAEVQARPICWGRAERCNEPLRRKHILLSAIYTIVVAFGLIWAGYRFSVGPIRNSGGPSGLPASVERLLAGESRMAVVATAIVETSVLAPEFFQGILWALDKVDEGHAPYLLGKPRHNKASCIFFPLVLAIKTPLPFVVAFLWGLVVQLGDRSASFCRFAAPAAGLALVAAVIPSTINLGVRHILPIYPLFCISAAHGLAMMWQAKRARLAVRLFASVLVLWLIVGVAAAHPDYLSYFNVLAGAHPERVVVDSDLDWGQDLHRMSTELRWRGARSVSIAYFGTAEVHRHGLPEYSLLAPHKRPTGWIAISLTRLYSRRGYEWLHDYQPTASVGRSMRLYYIPAIEKHHGARTGGASRLEVHPE